MTTINSFSGLKAVRKELAEKARLAEEERKQAAEEKARRSRGARYFYAEMAGMGVEPLRAGKLKGRAEVSSPKPAPIPRQSKEEHRAVLRASLSDEVDPLTFLQSEDGRCFWREGLSPDLCRKLRRGDWTVQNHIDLHGMRVDPAREAVFGFLKASQKAGARCVRIVHGKGYGSEGHQPVLKEKVRRWLKQCRCVMAFAEAPETDGGAGAVLVLLESVPYAGRPAPKL